jgi:hypothetical protein
MRRTLFIAFLLSGCSTVTYQHGTTSVSSSSFAITRDIGHLEIIDETGKATIDQAKTDEVQAINAAVQGAIQGITAAAGKP